jgi:hypothetical protein
MSMMKADFAKNCVGTANCLHKKVMGKIKRCSAFGCKREGTDRAHVHINGKRTIYLIMLCHKHNTSKKTFRIKKRTAQVRLEDCTCCSCGFGRWCELM